MAWYAIGMIKDDKLFSELFWPSDNLGIKVKTFWNSPWNVEFKNVLIFNPTLHIRWDKAKSVKSMNILIGYKKVQEVLRRSTELQ